MMKTIFFLMLIVTTAFAAVPQQINYQGFLTNSGGTPLDTTVQVVFRLYSASSGGAAVWTETHPAVTLSDGLFSVQLGSITALTDATLNAAQRWLSIAVGGDTEMTPRTRIVAVGYSYRVGTVDGASGGAVTSDVSITGRLNAGQTNTNSGTNAVVFGRNNVVSGDYSNSAGYASAVAGDYASVSGGFENSVPSYAGHIGGGVQNSTGNPYAAICGGDSNRAYGIRSFIGGGELNHITSGGLHAVIGGGLRNVANDSAAAVLSGVRNYATGPYSVVCGGGYPDDPAIADSNVASDYFTAIVGGWSNRASSIAAFVGGGSSNRALGSNSAVCGGSSNRASAYQSFVGGGAGNDAASSGSAICGGFSNTAGSSSNNYAFVGGGDQNEATGYNAVIAGGGNNISDGWYTAIPGGLDNTASGSYAFAAGTNVTVMGNYSQGLGANVSVSADSTFAWSDGSGPLFSIGSGNTFNVKANGGVRFWTTANHADDIGARLTAGGSAWTTLSDSTKKRNLREVNSAEILDKVSRLPIKQWSYKSQDPSIEHIGPTAQDFWNQFHVGDDSLTISTIDPSGIALAAIQELANENTALKARLAKLEALISRQATKE